MKWNRKLSLAAVGVLLLCIMPVHAEVAAPNAANENIELRLRLKPGQVFNQVIAIQHEYTTSYPGLTVKPGSTMKLRFEVQDEVLSVEANGNMRIRAIYNRVKYWMQSRGYSAASPISQYDSANPSPIVPGGAEIYVGFAGQSLVLSVSPTGQILKIDGLDEIVEHTLLIENGTERVSKEIRETIRDIVDEQARKISDAFPSFPEKSVSVGDEWKGQVENHPVFSTIVSSDFKLLSQTSEMARIGIKSSITPGPNAKPKTYTGTLVQSTFSGSQHGVLSVDKDTGWTNQFEMHQNITGKYTLTSNDKETNVVPTTLRTTIRGWTIEPPAN